MALNVALPLSDVSDVFEGMGLLSPLLPLSIDYRENMDKDKILISPLSESSGVSSLDSDEASKNNSPTSDSDQQLDDVDTPSSGDEFERPIPTTPAATNTGTKSAKQPVDSDLTVNYNGRNILDLAGNITDGRWNLTYTVLPKFNMKEFLKYRSQYHRLGAHGHIQDYTLAKCDSCNFQYPIHVDPATNYQNTSVITTHTTDTVSMNRAASIAQTTVTASVTSTELVAGLNQWRRPQQTMALPPSTQYNCNNNNNNNINGISMMANYMGNGRRGNNTGNNNYYQNNGIGGGCGYSNNMYGGQYNQNNGYPYTDAYKNPLAAMIGQQNYGQVAGNNYYNTGTGTMGQSNQKTHQVENFFRLYKHF